MANKITVSALQEVYNSMAKEAVVDWNGLELHVKKVLSFEEAIDVVNDVVDACYTEGGEFLPVAMEFALDVRLVEACTNVTLPKDAKKLYEIMYATGLGRAVRNLMNSDQIDDIYNACVDRIEYLNAQSHMEVQAQMKKMSDLADSLMGYTSNLVESMQDGSLSKLLDFADRMDGKTTDEAAVDAYLRRSEEAG